MALNEKKWYVGIRRRNISERRGRKSNSNNNKNVPIAPPKKRLAPALSAALTHQSAPKKNGNVSFLTQSGDG